MDKRALNETVAKAVRIEYIKDEDKLFLVFEITDEKFKQRIRADWREDIDLRLIEVKDE